ncbi:MAG: hypothetical protein EOP14_03770 [Pseudomonas sp.]|nr:MAG: hypothetical protein EOP14_03770 [Pseudomonas sp.]
MRYKGILTRVVVYGMYAACLLLYVLFQGSEYDWMSTGSPMDSPVNWEDDDSNNRSVLRGLVVTTAVGAQLLIYRIYSRREAILTSIFLGIVLIAFR